MLEAFGGETGIRTLGTLTRTPVFKTGALNQLDHLSSEQLLLYQPINIMSTLFIKKFIILFYVHLLQLYSSLKTSQIPYLSLHLIYLPHLF